MTIGLRPLEPSDWIAWFPDHDAQLQEKERVLVAQSDVLSALPEAKLASAELVAKLGRQLPRELPRHYRAEGRRLQVMATGARVDLDCDGLEAMRTAARLVPDDLVVMLPDADDTYILAAAALCFPTRWRLADKVGHPMLAIHAPVPGYAEQIGRATDKVMSKITAERPLWRQNWSIVDSPALYQPVRIPMPAPRTPAEAGEHFWLRSERQCLVRLPRSRAVVFSIRILQVSVAQACTQPGVAASLVEQIETMPDSLRGYKQLQDAASPLREYLRSALAAEQSQPPHHA
ncbi:MAG: DUF3445 domain-containing protein [Pseudomonadota bacterium]